jgi:hypothetical protein
MLVSDLSDEAIIDQAENEVQKVGEPFEPPEPPEQ